MVSTRFEGDFHEAHATRVGETHKTQTGFLSVWLRHDAGTKLVTLETVLPGAWLGVAGYWDFKGSDGWQEPVPLRRCHGCHTVGLDVETDEFVEGNIGCESCHGAGEWHAETLGLGPIHNGVGSEGCGQCHPRGRTPSGEFFFSVGFRPGHDRQGVNRRDLGQGHAKIGRQ